MAELSRGQILKDPEVIGTSTAGGKLILWDGDETNTVTIKAPDSVSANYTLTLPADDGTVSQFLQTDGSGNLSWQTVTASAAGSTGQLQYNNAGNFAGAAGLTTDGTHLTITAAGEIRFADTDSSNYVAFKSPGTVAANRLYTLPATIGSAGQVLKLATGATSTAATLEWADDLQGTGTTAAGSDTQVQFNDGGTAFGGDADFTYNKTTNALTVAGAITGGSFVADLTTIDANTLTTSSGSFSFNPTTSLDILADKPLRLYDADSSDFVGLSAPTVVTSGYTLTFPAAIGDVGDVLQFDASGVGSFASNIRTVNFIIDGGGAVITTGSKGFVVIDFACTVLSWTILGDVTGSIVVDVNRSTYAGFPSLTSIAGTELPTLTNAQKNQDLSLTTWTTTLAAGDVLGFDVDSVTSVTRVTVALELLPT